MGSKKLPNINYKSFLEAMNDAVVILNHEGEIVDSNKKARELLGNKIEGEKWLRIVEDNFTPSDLYILSKRGNRKFSIDTNAIDIKFQFVSLRDITELERIKDKLSHNKKLALVGEMVASISHQIKTPISSILLLSNSLLIKNDLAENIKEKIKKIDAGVNDINNIVKEMLLFSSKGDFNLSPLELGKVIEDIRASLKEYYEDKIGIEIINNIVEPDINMYINLPLFKSGIFNLVNNSIEAKSSKLKIILEVQNNLFKMVVEDNGHGMKIDQEEAFSPFKGTKFSGTGLGLPIVKSIINSFNGDIWIEETSKDGTKIIIIIPIKK